MFCFDKFPPPGVYAWRQPSVRVLIGQMESQHNSTQTVKERHKAAPLFGRLCLIPVSLPGWTNRKILPHLAVVSFECLLFDFPVFSSSLPLKHSRSLPRLVSFRSQLHESAPQVIWTYRALVYFWFLTASYVSFRSQLHWKCTVSKLSSLFGGLCLIHV